MRKYLIAVAIFLLLAIFIMIIPITVAAITNPESVSTMTAAMKEYTDGIVKMLKVAYCAQGVTALC